MTRILSGRSRRQLALEMAAANVTFEDPATENIVKNIAIQNLRDDDLKTKELREFWSSTRGVPNSSSTIGPNTIS
jgi:hypothetical protein